MVSPDNSPSICPVIAGPTAVGKTGLILATARRYPIEVISLDSRQIYRGLRIGTAQPSPQELAACPHHLIDFLSPTERWSAQQFRRDFMRAYREIRARNHLPVLVGGAGLYLLSVAEGFMPIEADPQQAAAVRDELDTLSDEALSAELAAIDPASDDRLHANDRYRRQRALEIHRLTGRTMTENMASQTPDPALGLDFPLIFLDRDRARLRRRISARVREMLGQGWLAETESLLAEFGAACPGLGTLGYLELIAHLQGACSLEEAVDLIIIRTGQYAKRQQTWFRARTAVATGEPESPDIQATLRHLLDTMS